MCLVYPIDNSVLEEELCSYVMCIIINHRLAVLLRAVTRAASGHHRMNLWTNFAQTGCYLNIFLLLLLLILFFTSLLYNHTTIKVYKVVTT